MFDKIFKKNKDFIKTDPNDKPKIRFEKVLFNRLEKEGYTYLKSKNEFVQNFNYGKRIIRLSYNSSFGLISSVQYFSVIIFTDLEKAFKKVFPKYGWTNWTIHSNHHWTDSWLCDSTTGEYTDKTINNLSNEFFIKIKPQIDKIFNEIEDYGSLEKIYNLNPRKYSEGQPPRLDKVIINGLILAKSITPEKYDWIKEQFLLRLDEYRGWDKVEVRKEIEYGLKKIEKDDIKINTIANTV